MAGRWYFGTMKGQQDVFCTSGTQSRTFSGRNLNGPRKPATTKAACGQPPISAKADAPGLARHISHQILPDPVIGDNTFEEVPESVFRPLEEPLVAVQLGLDLEDHQKTRSEKKKVEKQVGKYLNSGEENGDEEEHDEP